MAVTQVIIPLFQSGEFFKEGTQKWLTSVHLSSDVRDAWMDHSETHILSYSLFWFLKFSKILRNLDVIICIDNTPSYTTVDIAVHSHAGYSFAPNTFGLSKIIGLEKFCTMFADLLWTYRKPEQPWDYRCGIDTELTQNHMLADHWPKIAWWSVPLVPCLLHLYFPKYRFTANIP